MRRLTLLIIFLMAAIATASAPHFKAVPQYSADGTLAHVAVIPSR